ncbi:unnamed protein product [Lepeophtheirus salmonis]|uniref:(salmon louse) hypothetical protein n=1 Tax=Lepeophtheirus salmonis TaxID=72036 RepID=A0A7R8H8V7_LEPSM|nr:unnamed protein product [Lepeophtheirus salmonis]CAF2946260.1 unnamed protein product [Lepeophtheirus salmonis]
MCPQPANHTARRQEHQDDLEESFSCGGGVNNFEELLYVFYSSFEIYILDSLRRMEKNRKRNFRAFAFYMKKNKTRPNKGLIYYIEAGEGVLEQIKGEPRSEEKNKITIHFIQYVDEVVSYRTGKKELRITIWKRKEEKTNKRVRVYVLLLCLRNDDDSDHIDDLKYCKEEDG